jgi:hypothetical protein
LPRIYIDMTSIQQSEARKTEAIGDSAGLSIRTQGRTSPFTYLHSTSTALSLARQNLRILLLISRATHRPTTHLRPKHFCHQGSKRHSPLIPRKQALSCSTRHARLTHLLISNATPQHVALFPSLLPPHTLLRHILDHTH